MCFTITGDVAAGIKKVSAQGGYLKMSRNLTIVTMAEDVQLPVAEIK